MSWFNQFKDSILNNGEISSDLIGAGGSTAETSLNHYRYQHQQKIKEAIEATYPLLIRKLDYEWHRVWNEFWNSRPHSPRSLDFFPDVFLEHIQQQNIALELKELARFERAIDIYPWKTVPVIACPIEGISESSIIKLSPYDLMQFKAPVIDYFNETASESCSVKIYQVIIWLTDDGVEFRNLDDWELSVLIKLDQGIGVAIEGVKQTEEKITDFFKWLASSGLIFEINNKQKS